MSALNTSPLSSNWELLKRKLQASNPNPSKRKTPDTKGDPQTSLKDKKPKRQSSDEGAAACVNNLKSRKRDMRPRRTNRTGSDDGATINNRQNQSQKDTKLSASLTLWAEDNNIPAEDLARAYNIPLTATVTPDTTSSPLRSFTPEQVALFENESSKLEIGRYIAIDCEMVGVGEKNHESSALARVSVVNFHGNCVFDRFVKPKERVTDWRTWVSGVSPKNMENALSFEEAQKEVAALLKGRILVGHALKNDLECLLLGHPRRDIRDTSRHPEFRKLNKGNTPSLKKLATEILGITIQGGSHSSVEDARASMLLYRRFKDDFERHNQILFPNRNGKEKSGSKKKKK